MRSRDLALVAGIVLIASLAIADALRSGGGDVPSGAPETRETTSATQEEPEPPEGGAVTGLDGAVSGFPTGELHGSLVFTDAEDCRLREIGLSGGRERPLPRLGGDCRLWSPPTGPRLAYGLGGGTPARDTVPFKFADLNSPERDLGGYTALFGFITWSRDGQRAAWCGRSRTGFDLELGGSARRLPECPAAYTYEGEILYARGSRLETDTETVAEVDGTITYVSAGRDRSLGLVVDGERIVVLDPEHPPLEAELPPRLRGRLPVFAPNNCAALFPPPRGGRFVEVVRFACFAGHGGRFFGTAGAWSPDGTHVAVAEQSTIAFHRLVGRAPVIRYPAAAVELAWRS